MLTWLVLNTWALVPVDIYVHADDLKYADNILEEALGQYESVRLLAENAQGEWVPIEEVLPEPAPVPEKYSQAAPSIGIDNPGQSTGALSNKAVYLSQCHGWIYYSTLGRFSTQRGNLHDTIEDFHNPEGANQYLLQYLENAGAAVFTAKERDLNPNMDIADNDGAGYSEIGSGFSTGAAGFKDTSPWVYGENPFDAGSTRRFLANSGSVAKWIPDVPADGYYNVYVSWDSDAANDANAHYRITHKGGVIDRYFNQKVHGSTWQYVENLWLEEGVDSLTVELVGDSSTTGTYLSADAVRIGGGMGDVWRFGGATNRPRWESGAILYTQFNGAPASVYDPYSDGDGSDPSARSRWAAWEHPTGEDAVYLSWHSNAGGGTGTDSFYDDSYPVNGSQDLATFVQNEIMDSIRENHDSNWANRGVKPANFAEVNSAYNDEMPSTLVELGFHDSSYDTQFLLDPVFRRDASRAMARGIIRYFADKDGRTPVFLPEDPIHVKATTAAGAITISWENGEIGAPYGDAPTGYVLYQSRDGKSWDNGTTVTERSYTLSADQDEVQFFRVAATNAGGISFPSETVSVKAPRGGTAPILIVGAFDRLQRSSLFWANAGPVGSVKRMNLRQINAFDTSVPFALAMSETDYPFDYVSNEALTSLSANDYEVVIWIAGEESTYDDTFSHSEQEWIRQLIGNGGALIASGSEILWDLDAQGDSTDIAFADGVLGASMASDDANTYMVNGEGVLSGLSMDFSFDRGAMYNVEYPDVLDSIHPVIARYDNGEVAGILSENVALFGFPLEVIIDEGVQQGIMERLLGHFLDGYAQTEPSTEPSTEEPSTEPAEEPSTEEPSIEPSEEVEEKKGCQSLNAPTSLWMLMQGMLMMLFIPILRRKPHRKT